jgi:hypothetical protein
VSAAKPIMGVSERPGPRRVSLWRVDDARKRA